MSTYGTRGFCFYCYVILYIVCCIPYKHTYVEQRIQGTSQCNLSAVLLLVNITVILLYQNTTNAMLLHAWCVMTYMLCVILERYFIRLHGCRKSTHLYNM